MVLTHTDITVLLLGLGILLATARVLGEIANRLGQPAIVGELLAGILLGPTVLGNLCPQALAFLFPTSGPPALMLQGIVLVAIVLFLLAAGMDVDLSRIFRQGRAAMGVSISGIVFPFAVGLLAAALVPSLLGRQADADPLVFALCLATALAISAMPVIAKTLMDLNLYRSDLGMVVIAAAVFDDLIGWLIFAAVLGLIEGSTHGALVEAAGRQGPGIALTFLLVALYVLIMLTAGRWAIHKSLPWIQAKTTWPGGVLALVLAVSLLGASFTEWIGIHAVFGSFIAGVALGDSPHLRDRTRATIDQFVSFIFAPLFFASIGLQINFVEHFDVIMVVLVLVIATIGKVLGCGWGARWSGVPAREAWAIGFGMNARGAMGIILALLAFQYRIINEKMFVALVIMSLVTSMMSGTMMSRILQRKLPRRFSDFLHTKGYINPLQARERDEAIRELASAAAGISGQDARHIESAVLHRERMMPTGLGVCVAVPHARISGMGKPLVCLGISHQGIEFEAPDGVRSRMIFLILTPAEDDGAQLEILADISRTFLDPALREAGMRIATYTEFMALLRTREPQES